MENKSLKDINYKPLMYMDKAGFRVLKEWLKIHPYITIGVYFFLCTVLIFMHPFFGVLVGSFLYGMFAKRLLKQKNNIWKNFAEANGWLVIDASQPQDPRYIPPGIYGIGDKKAMSPIIKANFEGHECDIFIYQFTTGSGKSRKTHYYTVARVMLEKPFPHLILDSKITWALRKRGDATEAVKLEGNFSDSFTLYYKKNEHIDALSIITPDIMERALETSRSQDIEIIDNNLFFILHGDQRQPDQLKVVLNSVDLMADEIKHRSKTLRYTPQFSEQERIFSQIAEQSFTSLNSLTNNMSLYVFIFFGIPFIIFFVFGFFLSLANL